MSKPRMDTLGKDIFLQYKLHDKNFAEIRVFRL